MAWSILAEAEESYTGQYLPEEIRKHAFEAVLCEVPVSIPVPMCEHQQDFHHLYIFPPQSAVLVPFLPLCGKVSHHVSYVFRLAVGDERKEVFTIRESSEIIIHILLNCLQNSDG